MLKVKSKGFSFYKENPKIISTILIFLLFFIHIKLSGEKNYYADASYYWTIADSMFQNGKFNLLAFPETFRGYFFPTIISIIKNIGNIIFSSEVIGFHIFSAAIMAILWGIILPSLFDSYDKKSSKRILIGSIGCSILTIIFWGDMLQYPLSDIPAMVLFATGVMLLKNLDACFNKKKSSKRYGLTDKKSCNLWYLFLCII